MKRRDAMRLNLYVIFVLLLMMPMSVQANEKSIRPFEEVQLRERVQANEQTKEMIQDLKIENNRLIQLLNEAHFKANMFSFGIDVDIYVGRWPIHYDFDLVEVKNDYHFIGDVETKEGKKVYRQEENEVVQGALTHHLEESEEVKCLMIDTIHREKEMAATFKLTIKKGQIFEEKYLQDEVYVPALHVDGKVHYADVYLKWRGKRAKVILKNKTSEQIGAWLPIRHHVYMKES